MIKDLTENQKKLEIDIRLEFINLLELMLNIDPLNRISLEDILIHPFIKRFCK